MILTSKIVLELSCTTISDFSTITFVVEQSYFESYLKKKLVVLWTSTACIQGMTLCFFCCRTIKLPFYTARLLKIVFVYGMLQTMWTFVFFF